MKIGVPKEIKPQENRIGLTPESVKTLISEGHEVIVENNGGFEAGFENEQYSSAGAKIADSAADILHLSGSEYGIKLSADPSTDSITFELADTIKDLVLSITPDKMLEEKGYTGTANGVADSGEWVGITFDVMNAKGLFDRILEEYTEDILP